MSFIRVMKDKMAQVIQKYVLHPGCEGHHEVRVPEKCPS
ncbi:hypothetical protein JOC74_001608 [Bacillus capparidis]|uniref:Uncharacterized protein n=1 Tax=Bacillus capparidis TaxID=1840411 RepID=A0ABS4CVQ7_9BACI|nr:hypothetical protein [Bacillus capparidis]